jgi:DnaK suppressor protein
MDREEFEYFRRLLTERLAALSEGASKTVSGMGEGDQSTGDPTDQATVEGDRDLLLRMRDRDWKLTGKIREALDRIEDGTYGICEICGNEISKRRLMARPVTTLCIACKTLQEEEERRRGE